MQKAILDKATGVILKLTIDEAYEPGENEEVVELAVPIDLAGGYFKLDENGQKVEASQQEIEDSDVDDTLRAAKIKAKQEALQSAIDTIVAKGSTTQNLDSYFQALKNLQS